MQHCRLDVSADQASEQIIPSFTIEFWMWWRTDSKPALNAHYSFTAYVLCAAAKMPMLTQLADEDSLLTIL